MMFVKKISMGVFEGMLRIIDSYMGYVWDGLFKKYFVNWNVGGGCVVW